MLVTTVLAMCAAPAAAQEAPVPGPEIRVTRLGGTTRFSGPMRNTNDLRAMVNTNRNEIGRVFAMVDLASISSQVIDALIAGNVTDTTVMPGTHMQWMALKRSGRPDVLRNVRWAGRNSFDAFQVTVSTGGYTYTFVVPKVCGNLSLVSRVAVQTMVREEPAPPPPPPAPEPPAAAPPPPPPIPPVAQAVVPPLVEEQHQGWVASALFGTNFQANTDLADLDVLDIDGDAQGAASFAFTGQVGYLWQYVGLEALFDFTPSIDVTRQEIEEPSVSSYMANLITAIPFGPNRRFQPYVSGGIGAIRMSADVESILVSEILQEAVEFNNVSQSKFGWNLGVGASAFSGPVGFRADVRYFRAASSDTLVEDVLEEDLLDDVVDEVLDQTRAERLTRQLLSGLGYWRANVGLAIRW
jgi:opacity protein-like surface antigen